MPSAMTGLERRAVAVLAAILAARMLGLFLLLPVLALYTSDLAGATPVLVGLAVGAYGITQALLQIPFGALSDRFGRRPVIAAGLVVFALGSVVAAASTSIGGVIAGRALQGAGAISAAVTALLADMTRFEVRTRAMAVIGISIGSSFILSLVLGPLAGAYLGVPGTFLLSGGLAVVALALLTWALPSAPRDGAGRGSFSVRELRRVALDRELLPLDLGVFVLHLTLTASFVALPLVLRDEFAWPQADHWRLYLGAMAGSLLLTVPLILVVERSRNAGRVMRLAVLVLAGSAALLAVRIGSFWATGVGLTLFFGAFNFLEARLPTELSRKAGASHRGAALGVYASAQFLGAFAGGGLGGLLLGAAGPAGVFGLCAAAALAWWRFAGREPAPAAGLPTPGA